MENLPQRASVVRAGEGTSVWLVGDTYTFKATTESTGGAFALIEASVPPGSGPPPHVHTREDEAFYLLDGTLEVTADGETTLVGAGDFVFLPRGTLHWFRNPGVAATRALILASPGGLDRFFAEAGVPARAGEQAPPTLPEEFGRIAALSEKYGMRVQAPEFAGSPE